MNTLGGALVVWPITPWLSMYLAKGSLDFFWTENSLKLAKKPGCFINSYFLQWHYFLLYYDS